MLFQFASISTERAKNSDSYKLFNKNKRKFAELAERDE